MQEFLIQISTIIQISMFSIILAVLILYCNNEENM